MEYDLRWAFRSKPWTTASALNLTLLEFFLLGRVVADNMTALLVPGTPIFIEIAATNAGEALWESLTCLHSATKGDIRGWTVKDAGLEAASLISRRSTQPPPTSWHSSSTPRPMAVLASVLTFLMPLATGAPSLTRRIFTRGRSPPDRWTSFFRCPSRSPGTTSDRALSLRSRRGSVSFPHWH